MAVSDEHPELMPPEVKVLRVIQVTIPQGDGSKNSPVHLVDYYFEITEDDHPIYMGTRDDPRARL